MFADPFVLSRSVTGRTIVVAVMLFFAMVIYLPPDVPYRWERKFMIAQVRVVAVVGGVGVKPFQVGGSVSNQCAFLWGIGYCGQGWSFKQWSGYLVDNNFHIDMVRSHARNELCWVVPSGALIDF